MSSKIDLDFSIPARLELRWQDTGTLELQLTDKADVIQSLAGNTLTLDIYKQEYDIINTVTATLIDANMKAVFTIDSTFWTDLDVRCNYSFRIRRETAQDIKTIVNGEVILN